MQINSSYLYVLKENLTNSEYNTIFGYNGWINQRWSGSCYGMSATTLLSLAGLLPYSDYDTSADCLNDLDYPINDSDVSSLITYYQMLQEKEKSVIQQQYRSVSNRINK
ncbi:MAG: hypothetical protein LIO74_00535 [Ruminococcus sp.]|nr:hypothetical protein [Ruminococcus sp.]